MLSGVVIDFVGKLWTNTDVFAGIRSYKKAKIWKHPRREYSRPIYIALTWKYIPGYRGMSTLLVH